MGLKNLSIVWLVGPNGVRPGARPASNFIHPYVMGRTAFGLTFGLALAVIQPAQYANFLSSAQITHAEILEGERRLFEVDHCQGGRWLVEAWKLTIEFVDFTSRHHAEIDGKFDMFAVVRFSCALADTLGFSVIPPLGLPNFEDLLQKLPDRERKCFGADSNELVLRIATKINSMSVWQSP